MADVKWKIFRFLLQSGERCKPFQAIYIIVSDRTLLFRLISFRWLGFLPLRTKKVCWKVQ